MMPKVYYYTDDEVGSPWLGPDADRVDACRRYGYRHPRFIWYEWPGFEVTASPVGADVFVVRQRLNELSDEQVRGLPYLRGNEERHVFFDLNDHHTRTFPDIQAIYLRACCTREMLAVNPGIILWPWAVVDDLVRDYVPLPEGGFQYDVVYQGRIDHPWIIEMVELLAQTNLNNHLAGTPNFWPSLRQGSPNYYRELRKSYLTTMSAARLVLCPMSNPCGATRIRLFEAMAMGRFQVYFNTLAVFSGFDDKIDWDRCLLRLNTVKDFDKVLLMWLAEHSDEEIIERGRYARRMWQKWFAPGRWGRTAGIVVREKLGLGGVEEYGPA